MHEKLIKSGKRRSLFNADASTVVPVEIVVPELERMLPHRDPFRFVDGIDAVCLSGGSAFGLAAADGVASGLKQEGRGFALVPLTSVPRTPIVPAAILYDLSNGGDKDWGKYPPYRELGYEAAQNADTEFGLGSFGAGTGALTGGPGPGLKGGLGSASTLLDNGITIGALVAVNALGAPTIGDNSHFWAAPFEMGDEFGGLGPSPGSPLESSAIRIKFRDQQSQGANTTIGIIATDAKLTKGEANRLAIAAHDGFARALWPAHTPLDGDLIFSIATGAAGPPSGLDDTIDLSAIAASTMSRAIARGVYSAEAADGDLFPTWRDAFA